MDRRFSPQNKTHIFLGNAAPTSERDWPSPAQASPWRVGENSDQSQQTKRSSADQQRAQFYSWTRILESAWRTDCEVDHSIGIPTNTSKQVVAKQQLRNATFLGLAVAVSDTERVDYTTSWNEIACPLRPAKPVCHTRRRSQGEIVGHLLDHWEPLAHQTSKPQYLGVEQAFVNPYSGHDSYQYGAELDNDPQVKGRHSQHVGDRQEGGHDCKLT